MNAGQRIARAVTDGLAAYFAELDGETARGLYGMVINAAERPLFESVMKRTRGNQLAAAAILGINRNTLRKKLRAHGIKLSCEVAP